MTKTRACYCRPGQSHCASCQVCGRAGHLQHFPGAAPYTGAWCDWHYRRLMVLHPNGRIGGLLYPAVFVGLIICWLVFF